MEKILLKNIKHIITFNDKDEILEEEDILIEGPRIESIGKGIKPDTNTRVIDCKDLIAIPGFVNTHHHFYQALFRGIPEVQDKPLFAWLKGSYEFWKHLTPEAVYYGSLVAFSELLRTGCTTTADHHYVFPERQSGALIDYQIKAANEIGMRFHATRGSMSSGRSQGALPPDSIVQKEDVIIKDSIRLIEKYHDPSTFSMQRIALAPCSPFSVTLDLMKLTRDLAREKDVMLHTHLAETLDEEKYCIDKFGLRPFELMEELEWIGPDVWFAHAIHLNDEEIRRLNNTGVSHCPSSNMKLGSGICRTSEMLDLGVKLSIGVDGSASNDSSNMWEEIRRAYLLNHLKYGDDGMTSYQILKTATKGGAEVLGRNDIGVLDLNKAADIVLIDLKDIAYAGCHDPITAIVSCGNSSLVHTTIVNGTVVVEKGQIMSMDQEEIRHKAETISREMLEKEYLQK